MSLFVFSAISSKKCMESLPLIPFNAWPKLTGAIGGQQWDNFGGGQSLSVFSVIDSFDFEESVLNIENDKE